MTQNHRMKEDSSSNSAMQAQREEREENCFTIYFPTRFLNLSPKFFTGSPYFNPCLLRI